MTTIQIGAFYVVSLILAAFAVYFTKHKYIRLSGLLIVLSFLSFVFAQFSGNGFSTPFHGLTVEQYLCWVFGFLFLCLAVYFVHEKAVAYGFVLAMIAVACCFCGLSSVQSFLKTHMLWMVMDTLKSYGDRIDTYQTTVIDIQKRLSARQEELETNMNKQRMELSGIQATIRQAQTNILNQQSDITNQYYKISLVESKLTSAQTNLDVQQSQLSDVQSLVNTLFTNTVYEDFHSSDTNRIVIINKGGYQQVIFKFNKAPVPNTIQGLAYGGSVLVQTPLLMHMFQEQNILIIKYAEGMDLRGVTFEFRYIADNRQTSIVHSMSIVGTNAVAFDGQPYVLNF